MKKNNEWKDDFSKIKGNICNIPIESANICNIFKNGFAD